MRLYASQGMRGRVVDIETAKLVPKVIWIDVEAGELEAYKVDSNGKYVLDINGNYMTYTAKGVFRLLPPLEAKKPSLPKIVMGAPKCAKCSSPLTLQGDDLCPKCKAIDRGKPYDIKKITTPLLDQKCQHKGCSRLATWSVSDEVPATPSLGVVPRNNFNRAGKYLFDCAMTVGRRFYCDHHFVPPRILDAKGEVVSTVEDNFRPQ